MKDWILDGNPFVPIFISVVIIAIGIGICDHMENITEDDAWVKVGYFVSLIIGMLVGIFIVL